MPDFNVMSLSRKKYQKIATNFLFDMRKEHADEFLSAYSGTYSEFKDFWSVCKLVFTLSHGQSLSERGFSINKVISNMQEDTKI